LDKELAHYRSALATGEANGDSAAAERLRTTLAEVQGALDDVDYRAANIRAGYVYVISNMGAFGITMVTIGMTRRLVRWTGCVNSVTRRCRSGSMCTPCSSPRTR